MIVIILSATYPAAEVNLTSGYIIGIIIAVFLLGYLLYSLIKPEKF
ncbi:MAG: K(+)-transporting ATPase subunit F [Bacteroidales bacterium]